MKWKSCEVRRALGGALVIVLAAGLLAACGGDEVARTGGGGTGIASNGGGGTVTGFGSLIVDGERWDDRAARVEVERSPTLGLVAARAKLGQRVEIDYTSRGIAERVLIAATVIGQVSEISATATPPQFKVAGQTVRVNLDATAGPITAFEGVSGLSGAAALQVADVVEVHGSTQFDAQLNRHVIVASRVEKLPGLPAGLIRVSGVVQDYVAASGRFKLGELTVTLGSGSVLVPANRVLANGQQVVVWSDDPLGTSASGPTLVADHVRVIDPAATASGATRTRIAGSVSRLNLAAATFEVGGIAVNARSAIVVPANQSLADGRYVIIDGSFDSANVMQASLVRLRAGGNNDIEVELSGTITDFIGIDNFRVRGVAVTAAGVSPLSACPAGGLAAGLYVEIEGNVAGDRVEAERVRCVSNPTGIVTVIGVASAVSTTARTFTLTSAASATQSVRWTGTTYFEGVTADTLSASTVAVEGYASGGGLVATSIIRRN
jgi:hypothetical protein